MIHVRRSWPVLTAGLLIAGGLFVGVWSSGVLSLHTTAGPSRTRPVTDPGGRPAWAIAVSDRIGARVAGADVRQSSGDLDVLYEQAKQVHGYLKERLVAIARDTGGRVMMADGLKSRARSGEKIGADYQGDASRIFDLVRGRIVYPSIGRLYHGLDEVDRTMTIVRIKDRIGQPLANNYRDVLVNLRLPNGHIGEVQLHLEPIVAVTDEGHALYEQQRSLEAKAKLERRALTDRERRLIGELEARASRLYADAWSRVQP